MELYQLTPTERRHTFIPKQEIFFQTREDDVRLRPSYAGNYGRFWEVTQEEHIGHYVRRVYDRSDYQNTKWHKIESLIAARVVTKCGRQMSPVTSAKSENHFEYHDEATQGFLSAKDVCFWC